jgi:hypothetical protein
VNPGWPLSVRSEDPAGIGENIRDASDLWEAVFSRRNLMIALKRVERNRGAAGADGLRTEELRSWCLGHWRETREALDAGTYAPLPVRQVMIPKPDGGERKLGVPSVLDRLIQQAVAQVLSPVFDPGFVPVSYGFRPGRSAHDAVKVARTVIGQGYRWVVEVDLDAFFDRVNHDVLMARVARKVKDKRLRAAERVLEQSTKVLERDLKLRVNRQKSTINPASVATLLGFGFYFVKGGVKIRIAPKAFKRMKDRIRELTSRKWSISGAGCAKSGGTNGNSREHGWQICASSGSGRTWHINGATAAELTGGSRSRPFFTGP